ncbi:cellulose biosynthesis protein BcsQ [Agrobacterium larrymoorei]|uniref:Cellulose biosynthesis protein BcsQ n=1 Tax=Agrobacterium larrymoorei TaxID=160699 RepID=A0AAJ2ERJ5_9HYPH|nr:conjugal transfer ATPase VirC1 [Agrobacterium larrymoorei]MDR6101874.1 cellulose biosynthesis protein BcsQ [Agrobacterium larrymoorei]
MKMVTCCSFKGGAGKTTALMGLCSALLSEGKRVALFEADENRPLTKWRENAVERGTWDSACEIFAADEMALLEQSYERAEAAEFDFALADTHGGSSDLNNTIIASSNFLLVPTMLTPLDADEALSTYRYIIELLISERLDIPTALLRQRVPIGRLTSSQRNIWEMLGELPLTETSMHERDAFAAMKNRGMLHLSIVNANASPATRLMVRNLESAMRELASLSEFVQKAVER